MDLNSLPDEMFSLILKKTSFRDRNKLRKMSKRIDRLCKRASLAGRIPVEILEFYRTHIRFVVRNEDSSNLTIGNAARRFQWNHENSHLEQLQYLLSKMEIYDHLSICGNYKDDRSGIRSDRTIDIIKVLKDASRNLRHVDDVVLCELNFIQPLDATILSLYKIFPRLKCLSLKGCNYGNPSNKQITWDKTNFTRKLADLSLISYESEPNTILMDDEFLVNVAVNWEYVYIATKMAKFTTNGIINLLKKCVFENILTKNIHIGTIIFTNEPFDQFTETLRAKFPGLRITVIRGLPFYEYKIVHRSEKKEFNLILELVKYLQ